MRGSVPLEQETQLDKMLENGGGSLENVRDARPGEGSEVVSVSDSKYQYLPRSVCVRGRRMRMSA